MPNVSGYGEENGFVIDDVLSDDKAI